MVGTGENDQAVSITVELETMARFLTMAGEYMDPSKI